jgi:hypothetical protein
MEAKSVEYGRVVNLGNYENMRVSATYDLAPGETVLDGFEQAYKDVQSRIEQARAWGKEAEAAERQRDAPWVCTPEMVGDLPTLQARARRAAELTLEHTRKDFTEEARQKARERFGFDVPFERRLDNSAVATVDGVTFIFKYDDFSVEIPDETIEGGVKRGPYIRDLAKLGQWLAGLDDGSGSPF